MEETIEIKILTANMGSCQCGNVYTEVILDHKKKIIVTQPEGYDWMSGRLRGNEFRVSYAGGFDLPSSDYKHEIRVFNELEKDLFLK